MTHQPDTVSSAYSESALVTYLSSCRWRVLPSFASGHKIVVMKSQPPTRGRRSRAKGHVSAAEFKATCLELMDRVRETGVEYVVTKHGKPVAKLVPYSAPEKKPFIGSMKGTVVSYERPFDPIDGEYDINRD